ncbi:MAG TPA: hypothetical protein VFO39_20175 [Candidatus Sulfotelmatobacter sp.]|nr:hypothetical protein [Candidatus Sulfotelmatobacter sp.]
MKTLNEVYSSPSSRRRYEVWFIRLGLADGSGAWWFRYLLFNPGRSGCPSDPCGKPVQVWASWFPRCGKPQSTIRGFPIEVSNLSDRDQSPFHFRTSHNEIGENFCRGALESDEHAISWDLNYRSNFRVTLSDKGWIGFSRSPHSDAVFSGQITLDGRTFRGDPLGFGVQGHNCGYRHRGFWTWAHAYFPHAGAPASTLEALVYDMPFGLVFRKAVLWHEGKKHVFRKLQEKYGTGQDFRWEFDSSTKDGLQLRAAFDGTGMSIHRLPYLKTDCSGSFDVTNNSLAKASVWLESRGKAPEVMETASGAVLESVGER